MFTNKSLAALVALGLTVGLLRGCFRGRSARARRHGAPWS